MKHLVIVAHPRDDSLTMCLAHAYVEELAAQGHQHTLHDLYRLEFGPPEVLQAQQDIESADALTVIYPLWWLSMPAILKGYIDRVFARGFAFESRQGQVHGLLTGKKCVLVTLSGSPLPLLAGSGQWNAVKMLQDTHVFRAVGFDLLEHLHFDHIEPGLPATAVQEHVARVRRCAREHFGMSRSSAATAAQISSHQS